MGFWEEPQGAAVFKHAVLRRYAPTFASKVGKRSRDHRVEILDGYAGQGEYESGDPGSPLVFLKTATELSRNRQVHCSFIEEDPSVFAKLKATLDQAGLPDGAVDLFRGTMSQHLDTVLRNAEGVPLFAFIDPYGLGLPFDELVGKLLRRGHHYPTEVLVNFIRPGVYRQVGYLQPRTSNPTQLLAANTKVQDLDRSLGGQWWRQLAVSQDGEELLTAVREGYIQRVLAAAGPGWRSLQVPVADMPTHRAVYDLILFSRHPQGPWYFNDALSLARDVFIDHCDTGCPPKLQLFTPDAEWESEIAANMRHVLATKGWLSAMQDMSEIYGTKLGVARGKHVKAAAKRLVAEGLAIGDVKKEPHTLELRPTRQAVAS